MLPLELLIFTPLESTSIFLKAEPPVTSALLKFHSSLPGPSPVLKVYLPVSTTVQPLVLSVRLKNINLGLNPV
jgi:hypothetical protein